MNKRIEEKIVLKRNIKIFLSKLLITIIIFLFGMIVGKENPDNLKIIQTNLFEQSFPFQNVKNWYEKNIGKILSFDKNLKRSEPVLKEQVFYKNIQSYQNGFKVTVQNNYAVPILESGVVVYIGENEEYGKTIVIEQIDGVNTSYSHLKFNENTLYDYVEKGEILGEVEDDYFYVSFQKKGEYLDYKNYL